MATAICVANENYVLERGMQIVFQCLQKCLVNGSDYVETIILLLAVSVEINSRHYFPNFPQVKCTEKFSALPTKDSEINFCVHTYARAHACAHIYAFIPYFVVYKKYTPFYVLYYVTSVIPSVCLPVTHSKMAIH